MKEGNWYFDIEHKMFLKFEFIQNGMYYFKNPYRQGKKFLFFSFNPYPEFISSVTEDEIKRYELN